MIINITHCPICKTYTKVGDEHTSSFCNEYHIMFTNYPGEGVLSIHPSELSVEIFDNGEVYVGRWDPNKYVNKISVIKYFQFIEKIEMIDDLKVLEYIEYVKAIEIFE